MRKRYTCSFCKTKNNVFHTIISDNGKYDIKPICINCQKKAIEKHDVILWEHDLKDIENIVADQLLENKFTNIKSNYNYLHFLIKNQLMKTCWYHGFPWFQQRKPCHSAKVMVIDIVETQPPCMIELFVAKCENMPKIHLQKHFEILQC